LALRVWSKASSEARVRCQTGAGALIAIESADASRFLHFKV
jgi:hypothetical protein